MERLPLDKAMQQLKQTDSNENIRAFADSFKALVDANAPVYFPVEKTPRGNMLCMLSEKGQYYAVMFSGEETARKTPGTEMLHTDINKLIASIFKNDQVAGIVIDPYTMAMYLDKELITRMMGAHKGEQLHQWGQGVPLYSEADKMTPQDLAAFAMRIVKEQKLQREDYEMESSYEDFSGFPYFVAVKDGQRYLVAVGGAVPPDVPALTAEQKTRALSLAAAKNAQCLFAPVEIASHDEERRKAGLALRGDGFYLDCKEFELVV